MQLWRVLGRVFVVLVVLGAVTVPWGMASAADPFGIESDRAAASTDTAAAQPAQAFEPGAERTITDQYGNIFTWSITRTATGTGHGTTSACYVNAANGYTPGDNTAADDYMCIGDRSAWRVDWNVVTAQEAMPLILQTSSIIEPARSNLPLRYQWGGVEGGPHLPWTGSTNQPFNPDSRTGSPTAEARVTFKPNQSASGYFTLEALVPPGNGPWNEPYLSVPATYQTFLTARTGSTAGTAQADKPLTTLAGSRFDSRIDTMAPDAYRTTIDGVRYQGFNVTMQFEKGNGAIGTASFPGYSSGKGYDPKIDPDSTGLRVSVPQALAGVHFSINGGEPVPAEYGPDGFPYIDTATAIDSVKALVPFDALPEGRSPVVMRRSADLDHLPRWPAGLQRCPGSRQWADLSDQHTECAARDRPGPHPAEQQLRDAHLQQDDRIGGLGQA